MSGRVVLQRSVGAIVGCALLGIAFASPASGAGPYPGLTSVREAKQSKLSPRLLALTRSPLSDASTNAQADGLDLPRTGAGSLMRTGARSMLVYVRVANTSDATVGALRAAGLVSTHVSARYGVVTGGIEQGALTRLAGVSSVVSVAEALRPLTSREGATSATKASTAGSFVSCGSKTSEGTTHLAASWARSAFAVDGTGIEVGILSDSYDVASGDPTSAAQDIASGDIPGPGNPCNRLTPVTNLDEIDGAAGAIDEGRGMAQIVHDLAPGAELSFASAFNGFFEFADNIAALRAAGADVIVDDVIYLAEPMFQEGPIDIAITDAVADGALYFTSAGNSNVIVGGNNVSSYEAPGYRGTTCPAVLGTPAEGYDDCHDFDTSGGTDNTANITVAPGGGFSLIFQWAQPWNNVGSDLDVYLLNSATGDIVASSFEDQTSPSTSIPFEFFGWSNLSGSPVTVQVVLARWSGVPNPRVKFLLAGAGGISSVQYNTSIGGDVVGPTIWGHSGSPDAFSVGAVRYDTRNNPETFSSRGPRTLYFGPADGTNAAPPLGAPEVVPVPHIAATDGGANTFFGSLVSGTWRFFGTSASAPHAGAVAALMWEREGSLTRAEALDAFTETSHAVPVSGGPTSVGAGLVDALGALQEVVPYGRLRAFTTPGGAVPGNLLFGTTWMNQWATDWVKVPVGSYSVSGTAVEGFDPPAPIMANVTANTDTVVPIPYTTLGNLRVITGPLDGLGRPPETTISIDGVRVNDFNFYAPFPAGAHQVCFGPAPGYDPPSCQNVNVVADRTQLTTVNATFTPNAAAPGEAGMGLLRVVPQPVGSVPTVISLNGQRRNQWALDWLKLPPGAYTLSFSDVEGFRAPAPQQVQIVAGQTTEISPSFTVLGNLRVFTNLAQPLEATLFIDGKPINDGGLWTPFPAGSHEVCFGWAPGFVSPPCQAITVPASRAGLLTIQGVYTAG